MRLRGLDVSQCQGVIDWHSVPAEFRFIIAKATEGAFYADPAFVRNVQGIRETGRAWAPYHFCRPGQDPIAQITELWKAIGDTMPDFRPALDLESAPNSMTPEQILAWFLECADEAERYFGVPPLLYTYPWWYRTRVAPALSQSSRDRLARCPLWMADYSHGELPLESDSPFVPVPWRTWTMWQTSGDKSSHVPGIATAVDHDIFNGDETAFRRFRGLPDSPADEPTRIIHPEIDLTDD